MSRFKETGVNAAADHSRSDCFRACHPQPPALRLSRTLHRWIKPCVSYALHWRCHACALQPCQAHAQCARHQNRTVNWLQQQQHSGGMKAAFWSILPISGRCPRLKILWEEPLMKGPSLVVDNRSFVEIASAMISSLQPQLPWWPVSHLVQQGLVMMEVAKACPTRMGYGMCTYAAMEVSRLTSFLLKGQA